MMDIGTKIIDAREGQRKRRDNKIKLARGKWIISLNLQQYDFQIH